MRPSTAQAGRSYSKSSTSNRGVGCSLREFRILGELGKGAYGVVYRVQSLKDNQEYVLKKIPIKHLKRHEIQDVITEAKILRKLEHKHIIKSYSHFVENGALNIIMEYAKGGDLQKFIKSKEAKNVKIAESEIWRIAYQLALALSYLHEHCIIHRDIKTLNIFLDENNGVKLGDMGVSKIVDNALCVQGTRVGTPLYLAPELVRQKPYDFKIDIWAMGCVLFHLCTKNPPFYGKNLVTLGYNIVNNTPKKISSSYSKELKEFIWRLLKKRATKRPSAVEVVSILKEKLNKGIFDMKMMRDNIGGKIEVQSPEKMKRLKSHDILKKKLGSKKSLLMDPETELKRIKVKTSNMNSLLLRKKNSKSERRKKSHRSHRKEERIKREEKSQNLINIERGLKSDRNDRSEKSNLFHQKPKNEITPRNKIEIIEQKSEEFKKNNNFLLKKSFPEVIEERSVENSSKVSQVKDIESEINRGGGSIQLKKIITNTPKKINQKMIVKIPGNIAKELNEIEERVSHIEKDLSKKNRNGHIGMKRNTKTRSAINHQKLRYLKGKKIRNPVPVKKGKIRKILDDNEIKVYSRQRSLKEKIQQMERNLKKNHSFYRNRNKARPKTAAPSLKLKKESSNLISIDSKKSKEEDKTIKSSIVEKDKRKTQTSTFVGTKTHFQNYNEPTEKGGRKPRPKTAVGYNSKRLKGVISHPFLNPFQTIFKTTDQTHKRGPRSLVNVWTDDSQKTLRSNKELSKQNNKFKRPKTAVYQSAGNRSHDMENSEQGKRTRYRIKTAYVGSRGKKRSASSSIAQGDKKQICRKFTIHDLG